MVKWRSHNAVKHYEKFIRLMLTTVLYFMHSNILLRQKLQREIKLQPYTPLEILNMCTRIV